jgi:hypothetical protein
MFTKEELNAEIILAKKKVISLTGVQAVIKETKFSKKAKKSWLGFHFEPVGSKKVGDTGVNSDGSLFTVVAVVEA